MPNELSSPCAAQPQLCETSTLYASGLPAINWSRKRAETDLCLLVQLRPSTSLVIKLDYVKKNSNSNWREQKSWTTAIVMEFLKVKAPISSEGAAPIRHRRRTRREGCGNAVGGANNCNLCEELTAGD